MKNFAKLIFICLCFCFFVFACDNTGNMLDRADTYHKNGEYDKAESVYQQILKKKPDHPDALKGMGNIRLAQKDYTSAIDYYKKAVEADPRLASKELVSFIAYREPEIRNAVMNAIASLKNSKAKERVAREIISQMKTANQYALPDYLEALKHTGGAVSSFVPDILPLLDHEYDEVRKSALEVLSSANPSKLKELGVIPKIAELVNDPNTDVSETALRTIVTLKSAASEVIPVIIQELAGTNSERKRAARSALSEIGPGNKAAIPGLIGLLVPSNVKEVRIAAMDSLAAMGSDANSAVYALIPLLQDSDNDINLTAAAALNKIGRPSADTIPNFINLLKDGNVNTQLRAIAEISEMGKAAISAIDALSELAETSKNAEVKSEAQKAVEKIIEAQE